MGEREKYPVTRWMEAHPGVAPSFYWHVDGVRTVARYAADEVAGGGFPSVVFMGYEAVERDPLEAPPIDGPSLTDS